MVLLERRSKAAGHLGRQGYALLEWSVCQKLDGKGVLIRWQVVNQWRIVLLMACGPSWRMHDLCSPSYVPLAYSREFR